MKLKQMYLLSLFSFVLCLSCTQTKPQNQAISSQQPQPLKDIADPAFQVKENFRFPDSLALLYTVESLDKWQPGKGKLEVVLKKNTQMRWTFRGPLGQMLTRFEWLDDLGWKIEGGKEEKPVQGAGNYMPLPLQQNEIIYVKAKQLLEILFGRISQDSLLLENSNPSNPYISHSIPKQLVIKPKVESYDSLKNISQVKFSLPSINDKPELQVHLQFKLDKYGYTLESLHIPQEIEIQFNQKPLLKLLYVKGTLNPEWKTTPFTLSQ